MTVGIVKVDYWRGERLLDWVIVQWAVSPMPSLYRCDFLDIDPPDRVTWTDWEGAIVREFRRCHGWAVRVDDRWEHLDPKHQSHP